MCFSFAAKMAGDTNQLRVYVSFVRAGNEDSAERLIQTLNPSSIVDVGLVDFTKLPKDILGTSLIPGVEESKSKIKNGISKK